jgi:hypothetical protein
MTTARTATRKPAPRRAATEAKTTPAELTPGERLAADLRVLAELAASTPPLTEDLTAALQDVTVVLRVGGGGQDVLAAALAEHAAVEQPGVDPDDLFFAQRSWLLPNRAITVSGVSLAPLRVDDIEAAGR